MQVAQFAAGRLPESLDAFRRALLEDGTDDAARHDYEVVLRLLYPTPEAEETPEGSAPTPPAGTPQPGSEPSQQPGAGTPQPGSATPAGGTPQPGASPQAGGTPTPSNTAGSQSKAELDRQIRDIDQRVERLLEDAGETPSPAQALEILRLLAERSRIAGLRDALNGGGGAKDY